MQRRMMQLVAAMFCAAAVVAQPLDRIVAVVGDDMILESELNAQVQMFQLNNRIDPKAPGLREMVLQNMINEKLIVAKAIEDSVTVSEDEVTQQLDNIIQQRVQAAGGEAKLEELYGMSLSRIRREFREEMRKSLIAQRLQQQRFGTASVSHNEVVEFFNTYKDSLGEVPEEIELAHIFIKPRFDDAAKERARQKLLAIIDSIKAGVSFEDLAKRHSQDLGSASQGGDLGLVRRGLFVKEFESAVFGLKEKELSGIVETEFGLHVIQLIERRGDAVRPRHILIRIERTEEGDNAAKCLLDSLRQRVKEGANFAELARQYSEDKETQSIGGSLGTFEINRLPRELYPVVVNMKEGEISDPVRLPIGNQYGYSLIWVKRRILAHKPSLEQDYRRIESIAANYKRQKEYAAWLEDLKKQIYWESRL